MEIIFDCPHCEQELSVDAEGAGQQIKCPTCGETLTIPRQSTKSAPEFPPVGTAAAGQPVSAMASSAAAKVVMHLKVPMHDRPGESLIEKPKPPLEAVARGAGRKMIVRTIRHASCIESGHDKFDEKVAEFLNEVGEPNLIAVHMISYTHFDVGTQKLLTDYGVMVVYRG